MGQKILKMNEKLTENYFVNNLRFYQSHFTDTIFILKVF